MAEVSKDYVLAALDNLDTSVVLFDEQYVVRYLNQQAESLLALSLRHVLGHALDPEVLCDERPLQDVVAGTNDGQPVTKRGISLVAADRTECTVDCVVTPALTDCGERITLVELQQVDRQNRIRRETELLSQQAATRDLVRGLAHEIKNPLGGLRGAAQLLAGELPEPDLQEYTRIIIEEADRLQELVNRMLGPNRRPVYQQINVHDVLERVRSLLLAEITDRNIQIVRDYDPSIPELTGDLDQLIQAVLNVVRNAICALEDAGVVQLRTRIARNFTIGQECHRLVARVEIIDNGPGIPPEIADTLFLPMITSGGGHGLGLSIAQAMITQHAGLIECSSRPGETVFTILLPISNGMKQGKTVDE